MGQTKPSSMPQLNQLTFFFSKFSKKNTTILLVFISTLFISSCSTPPKKSPAKVATPAPQEEVVENKPTAEKTLAQASQASVPQAKLYMVQASQLFFQEANYAKALWLADKTLGVVDSTLVEDQRYSYELTLIKAASLHALNYTELSFDVLTLADTQLKNSANEHSLFYYQTLSSVLQAKSLPVSALEADLYAFSLNQATDKTQTELLTTKLWHNLQSLSQWQLKQLDKSKAPYGKGWLQLTRFANKFGAEQEKFNRYLQQWQRQFPTHPATPIALLLAKKTSQENSVENIAILLPLTGGQQSAGVAAQQGILAAYNNDESKKLQFIDTNQIDWNTLSTTFSEHNIQYVIGPLLKRNVESYLMAVNGNASTHQHADTHRIDSPSSDNQPEHETTTATKPAATKLHSAIPTLLLNLPEEQRLLTHQIALSMRPEDEAKQAAATLSQANFIQPVILSHQDKVSKRIAKAFAKQWQITNGNAVDIVYFEKGKQMQTNLKASLDVNASQARIDELKRRLKQTIKAETRNRRDIDMIYVVGSSQQTRLVKPYIDVNISSFADVIPVYASSRSHSAQHTESNRDLQGLIFSEMPWMLDSKEQNKPLLQTSQQLWPKRSDSLSRIFAMGYDSYHLINKTALMKQAPYIQHFGQTGVLQLNANNILTRSLVWGRYHNDKVKQIAME